MNLGQACRPCRGSCSLIPGRRCFGDLPGDETVVFPPSPIVEPLEGGDTTIPSPGRSQKQLLPGIRLHYPLHGRQTCPDSNLFNQEVGQMCPRYGLFSCRALPKRGQICDFPAPLPLILERLNQKHPRQCRDLPKTQSTASRFGKIERWKLK